MFTYTVGGGRQKIKLLESADQISLPLSLLLSTSRHLVYHRDTLKGTVLLYKMHQTFSFLSGPFCFVMGQY